MTRALRSLLTHPDAASGVDLVSGVNKTALLTLLTPSGVCQEWCQE